MRFPLTARLIGLLLIAFLAKGSDTFASREVRYQLHPGDVVSVEYRYSPEFNSTVAVQPDGFASFPGVGSVKIGGLNLDQAQAALIAKASERLQDPEITMVLKEFEKPYIVVGGEVGSPGKVEFHGHLTALRAIELAGGFRSTAKSSQILLIRQINNVDAEVKLIDLKKVIANHELSEDTELRAGDMLIVPQSHLSQFERIVRLANLSSYGLYVNPLP
jgi:polysaccharide export outer membrane protein